MTLGIGIESQQIARVSAALAAAGAFEEVVDRYEVRHHGGKVQFLCRDAVDDEQLAVAACAATKRKFWPMSTSSWSVAKPYFLPSILHIS